MALNKYLNSLKGSLVTISAKDGSEVAGILDEVSERTKIMTVKNAVLRRNGREDEAAYSVRVKFSAAHYWKLHVENTTESTEMVFDDDNPDFEISDEDDYEEILARRQENLLGPSRIRGYAAGFLAHERGTRGRGIPGGGEGDALVGCCGNAFHSALEEAGRGAGASGVSGNAWEGPGASTPISQEQENLAGPSGILSECLQSECYVVTQEDLFVQQFANLAGPSGSQGYTTRFLGQGRALLGRSGVVRDCRRGASGARGRSSGHGGEQN